MATRIIENYLIDTIEILGANGNWRCEVRIKSNVSAQLLKSAALKATFDTKERAEQAGLKAAQQLVADLKRTRAA